MVHAPVAVRGMGINPRATRCSNHSAVSSIMTNADPLLTKATVAQLLCCSERTLERMVRADAFPPALRHGKEALWFASAVQQWLQRQRQVQLAWAPAGQTQAPLLQGGVSTVLAVADVADMEQPASASKRGPAPSVPAALTTKRPGRPNTR